MQQCSKFLVDQGLLGAAEAFFSNTPHQEAPYFIAAWIMHK
jgi:hypothetical protein